MMTKKSRLIAMILSLSLLFSAIPSIAFADTKSEEGKEKKIVSREVFQAEVEKRLDEYMKDIIPQLEAQNALEEYDDFREIFYPDIELAVAMRFEEAGIVIEGTEALTTAFNPNTAYFNFPYGGTIKYNDTTNYVLKTCLDYDNSYYYILSSVSQVSAAPIVQEILGYLPWGGLYSALFTLQTMVDNLARNSVFNAGGYAMITTKQNLTTGNKVSVLTGWADHPYGTAPSAYAVNSQFQAFSQHNPWG